MTTKGEQFWNRLLKIIQQVHPVFALNIEKVVLQY